jgi:hypothetical protein
MQPAATALRSGTEMRLPLRTRIAAQTSELMPPADDHDARARWQLSSSHLVEEDEGSDASPFCRGQHAANFKSSDVARTRHDDAL